MGALCVCYWKVTVDEKFIIYVFITFQSNAATDDFEKHNALS
jgi:hypothetical protein